MKKLNLWLFASLFVAAFTLTACGDDDDPEVPNSDVVGTNDLIGTWKVATTDDSYTYTFTESQLTIKYNNEVEFQGTYTFQNGTLTYSQDGRESSFKPGLLINKSVLVLKTMATNDDGKSYEELAVILFKEGKTINTNASDIQGNWHWYAFGDESYIRTGLKLEGNKFELVITPWGEKYVGTFTYANGIIKLNTTAAYTSREEHTGYGSMEGDMNPATLEGNWKTLDPDHWHVDAVSNGPFIANGNEAYGCVANLMCLYHKK